MAANAHIHPVKEYLLDLQDAICRSLEREDGGGRFAGEDLPGERGGLARPRLLSGGAVFEKAAVSFSHTAGGRLPETAAARRPGLAGSSYEAVSVSVIAHARNPYVPTAHANLRFFLARRDDGPHDDGPHDDGPRDDGPHRAGPRDTEPSWWFAGGFDLTPCYGFEEDAIHWHRTARAACEPFGPGRYLRCKNACDDYFYLPHRSEARGVGGLLFDDLREPGFEGCFAFTRSVGDHFLPAYLPIVRRRKHTPHGERERRFQLHRRGRYAEFNLLYDRGTRFGLEAGVRVESVLASLPPLASWRNDPSPKPGSPEERLVRDYLRPRDWLGELGGSLDSSRG